jgi:transposase InsO family protein
MIRAPRSSAPLRRPTPIAGSSSAAASSNAGRRALEQLSGLVTPDTILRWYRELIAKKYDGTGRRGGGRSGIASALRRLVVQFATENPTWGYTRIRGALSNLGHEVGRNTIRRVLAELGLDPAPKRSKTMSWKTFLKAHFGMIAATDFFTVEVLTLRGLVRYVVWFVIDLESRRVHIAGLTRHPHDAWIQQIGRNLTDSVDGLLRGKRYLIHDRGPLFTETFRAIFRAAGIKCLKLPAHSPNLNAFSERFVLSIKSECLDKLVPLGERHLCLAISEFVAHYHLECNHQGLDNRLIATVAAPANENADPAAPIARRERLDGLLSYYYHLAA